MIFLGLSTEINDVFLYVKIIIGFMAGATFRSGKTVQVELNAIAIMIKINSYI